MNSKIFLALLALLFGMGCSQPAGNFTGIWSFASGGSGRLDLAEDGQCFYYGSFSDPLAGQWEVLDRKTIKCTFSSENKSRTRFNEQLNEDFGELRVQSNGDLVSKTRGRMNRVEDKSKNTK